MIIVWGGGGGAGRVRLDAVRDCMNVEKDFGP